jgi:hypothetical protein
MKAQIQNFACPIARYWGADAPGDREFNAHLQFFAHRVSLLAGLHTGGKLPTDETYRQLLALWEGLQPYCSLICKDDAYSSVCYAPAEDSPNGTFPLAPDAD